MVEKESEGLKSSVKSLKELRDEQDIFVAKNSHFRKVKSIIAFLAQMNRNCATIGMHNSLYDSPHGLGNPNNKSTAFDQTLLVSECLKDPRFVPITHKRNHRVKASKENGNSKDYFWDLVENNGMVELAGYTAIKSGWTPNAGSCLATVCELSPHHPLIIMIIGCKMKYEERKYRCLETVKIAKWVTQRVAGSVPARSRSGAVKPKPMRF